MALQKIWSADRNKNPRISTSKSMGSINGFQVFGRASFFLLSHKVQESENCRKNVATIISSSKLELKFGVVTLLENFQAVWAGSLIFFLDSLPSLTSNEMDLKRCVATKNWPFIDLFTTFFVSISNSSKAGEHGDDFYSALHTGVIFIHSRHRHLFQLLTYCNLHFWSYFVLKNWASAAKRGVTDALTNWLILATKLVPVLS